MKRLYEKDELAFSLVWIGIYVAAFSLADGLSDMIGTAKLVTAPVAVLMSGYVLSWIGRNGLKAKCGLCKVKLCGKDYLWFLPLAVMASVNFWGGAAIRFSALETVLYIISMLGVGLLEEIIFRGFLFTALRRDSLRRAFWISSLTFGMGHIINLLGGADFFPTLLQIIYATAGGLLFTMLFHRSGTLLPCIAGHAAINALDAFCVDQKPMLKVFSAIALTFVALLYTLWIWKKTPQSH